MADQSNKMNWIVTFVTSLLTSLVVLAGSYLSFMGSDANAEASKLESAFQRIESLETQLAQQQATSNAKIVQLTSEVFRLRTQLNKDLDIVDMFSEFMDGLPFEAWLKEVDVDEQGTISFRTIAINKKYEFTHGVSQSRYVGSTDESIWGETLSEIFRESDLEVLQSKSSLVEFVTYPDKPWDTDNPDQYKKRMVVRVHLELIDGQEMIFGMAINQSEYQ